VGFFQTRPVDNGDGWGAQRRPCGVAQRLARVSQEPVHRRVEAKMAFQWDWQVYLNDTGSGQTYLQWMMSAWGWTIAVATLAWFIAFIVGSLIGVLRTVPHKGLQFIGNAWVELFRNIPLLVQLFL